MILKNGLFHPILHLRSTSFLGELSLQSDLHFLGFVMAGLIKLAKIVGVMHEADHAYSIRSTWSLHRLATDVPFIACVINSLSIFAYDLDLSNFL